MMPANDSGLCTYHEAQHDADNDLQAKLIREYFEAHPLDDDDTRPISIEARTTDSPDAA